MKIFLIFMVYVSFIYTTSVAYADIEINPRPRLGGSPAADYKDISRQQRKLEKEAEKAKIKEKEDAEQKENIYEKKMNETESSLPTVIKKR